MLGNAVQLRMRMNNVKVRKIGPLRGKKRKVATKFNSSHSESFPIMKPSRKGQTYGICAVCYVNISIARGGRDDIKKHVEGQKHQSAVKVKDCLFHACSKDKFLFH